MDGDGCGGAAQKEKFASLYCSLSAQEIFWSLGGTNPFQSRIAVYEMFHRKVLNISLNIFEFM